MGRRVRNPAFKSSKGMKTMAPRLKEKYQNEVAPKIMEELGIKNPTLCPKLEKIVVNMMLSNK